jgi:uncharacterized protein YjiS (DUF1127 family)
MTLSEGLFTFYRSIFIRRPPVQFRLYARGCELDPKTAMSVADLSPHLLKDIGVTDYKAPKKPLDRLPLV